MTPEERKSDVAELNQTQKVSTLSFKGARSKECVEEKTESETKWSQMVARRHKRYTNAGKVVTQPTPDTVNRYELPWMDGRDELTTKQVGEKGDNCKK